MKIAKIRIKNYRNINDIHMDFTINSSGEKSQENYIDIKHGKMVSNIYGIFGPNAIGKTNIMIGIGAALSLLDNSVEKGAKRTFFQAQEKNIKNNGEHPEQNSNSEEKEREAIWNNFKINEPDKFDTLMRNEILDYFSHEAKNRDKPIEFILTSSSDLDSKIYINIFKDNLEIKGNPNFGDYKLNVLSKKTLFLELSELFNSNKGTPMANHILTYQNLDVATKLLQIADPAIDSLSKSKSGSLVIKLDDGNEVNMEELSWGTKHFLHTAFGILKTLQLNKSGIFFIDELTAFMHKELSSALISLMELVTEHNNAITFMFIAHDLSVIQSSLKYKQSFEISKEGDTHKAEKVSTYMKQHESLTSRSYKGRINQFPSQAFVYDHLEDIIEQYE